MTKKPDPIFAMFCRLDKLSKKIDRLCKQRDEIEGRYPEMEALRSAT